MTRITPDRWSQVDALFDEAFELDTADRAAFLARIGTEDPALRDEVAALLAAAGRAGSFLEVPAAAEAAAVLLEEDAGPSASAAPPFRQPGPGDRIGRYRIERLLATGGMGSVYLAERADGQFDQQVALKLIRRGLDADDILARFLRERQILARLVHPNIAQLLDGGVAEDGQPYFCMEYVEGEPLAEYCDRNRLDIPARLELFMQVCEAVQFAHQNLVVHRDLKPSNTLVTPDGRVKLLDFGIAKVLHEEEADVADATRVGLRVMTPDYAAPEQVRGDPVTTATDVYALGAMLYELVSGHPAHRLARYTAAEVEREICEQEPLPPSTVVTRDDTRPVRGRTTELTPATVSHVRGTTADRLRRQLRGDLDAIVLQALQKDPSRRYASAEALLQDLRRYRAGLPVTARRVTFAYRLDRFVRRHAVAVAAAALVLTSLLAGFGSTLWQARVAAAEAAKAREVSAFLASLFEVADPDLANADRITARELLETGARRIETELRGQPAVQADMLALLGEIHRKLGLFERADSLLEHALTLRTQLHGAAHADVAASLAALGSLRADQGRHEDAERLLREALAIRRARLGAGHSDVARGMRELSTVLSTLGSFDEAEALQRRALEANRRRYGPRHAEVALDLANLSSVLSGRGDHEGAIAAAREVLAIRTDVLGDNHLETATAMNNLAILLSDAGEYEEAETLYRYVLDFDIERLGEVHPYTAAVMNNLAGILQQKGELGEAEALYRRALAIDIELFGEQHPSVATVLNNLGFVLRDAGKLEASESAFRDALAMFRAIFGEEHPSVGTAHAVLASTVHRRGRLAEADSLYDQALDRLRRAFPDGHPRTAAALTGRGRLLLDRGDAQAAESALREALTLREATFGGDDPVTADVRRLLGAALTVLGRFDEAEPLLLSADAILAGRPGSARQERDAAHSLAELYEAWGRPADAAPYRARLVARDP
jgi:tetratricopeptide (TPR) repeat protein/predicted Ser/Thr protein kinase